MNRQYDVILKVIVVGLLMLCAVVIVTADMGPDTHSSSGANANTQAPVGANLNPTVSSMVPMIPTVIVTGTIQVINRRHILAGEAPEQIAQYAIRNFAPGYLGPQGPVEVVLARPVTREQMPGLGLGCLPENVSSEEPPYVLVILKGDFDMSGVPGRVRLPSNIRFTYALFVIDVWSAGPTVVVGSTKGGEFRTVLNDPSLPPADAKFPTDCPPRVPGNLPHGAVIPGIVFPTSPPAPTPIPEAILPIPPPVPTEGP